MHYSNYHSKRSVILCNAPLGAGRGGGGVWLCGPGCFHQRGIIVIPLWGSVRPPILSHPLPHVCWEFQDCDYRTHWFNGIQPLDLWGMKCPPGLSHGERGELLPGKPCNIYGDRERCSTGSQGRDRNQSPKQVLYRPWKLRAKTNLTWRADHILDFGHA